MRIRIDVHLMCEDCQKTMLIADQCNVDLSDLIKCLIDEHSRECKLPRIAYISSDD